MDRNFVYPGSIPLDTDILSVNANVLAAVGYLAQAVFGTAPVVDGLSCAPAGSSGLQVTVGPGSITAFAATDAVAYGSLPANGANMVKMGINAQPVTLSLTAPTAPGQSIAYLVQANFVEADGVPSVLSYYNAANPALPFAGPGNTGTAQNTARTERVNIRLKAGGAAPTGSQAPPPTDTGAVGLYVINVVTGQVALSPSNIVTLPTAPFLNYKLPQLRPGFGSGIATFASNNVFSVPAGVAAIEAEVWGGGSGAWPGTGTLGSGGGSGGGYARRRIDGLTPGAPILVTVGAGGLGGIGGLQAPTAGGTSSVGPYVSATGGTLYPTDSFSYPSQGGYPGGSGIGGDFNATGSGGGPPVATWGGQGGMAPHGTVASAGQSIGPTGNFPGGGGAGAGTLNAQPAPGGAGANGFVIIRW